jgi:spore coat polysaccharide biosynthesis protein SpsF
MDVAVVIQARMGSSRAPGKIAYIFQGESMLAYQIKRLQHGGFSRVYVATSELDRDNLTVEIAKKAGAKCFRGSECDVMSRYLECANKFDLNLFYRVTVDDPLVDPEGMKILARLQSEWKADLTYSNHPDGWVYGTTAELVTYAALARAFTETSDPSDREHVIPYLKRSGRFNCVPAIPSDPCHKRPDIYLSVDYPEDLHLVDQVLAHFSALGRRYDFTQDELIALYDSGTLDIRNKHLHSGF